MEKETLAQFPSRRRLRNEHNVRGRSRRLVLGIDFGSLTGFAVAWVVASIMMAAVIYIKKVYLIKGPSLFDSRLGAFRPCQLPQSRYLQAGP